MCSYTNITFYELSFDSVSKRDFAFFPHACHGHGPDQIIPFVMHICGDKFQEHCFNISRGIFCSVCYHF